MNENIFYSNHLGEFVIIIVKKEENNIFVLVSRYLTKNSQEHWLDKHISPMWVLLSNMLKRTPVQYTIFFLLFTRETMILHRDEVWNTFK